MDSNLEQARTLFLEGLAHYEAGRLQQAELKFAGALSLAPGRPSVLTNLGVVRLRLGRAEQALVLLQEALAQEPDNRESLAHCATALAELGRPAEALPVFDRALAQDPQAAGLWMMRGSVLKELGRREEAALSFRESIARGGDPEMNAYYLAGLEQGQAPERAPRHYVEALFDGYAGDFEEHLVQALRYEAPAVLVQRIAAPGRRFANALDLGCGTGLCGRLLRPLADRLTGIDLSGNMVEKARAHGDYDELQQADVLEFLARSQERYDLVMAADVFVYVGALDEVFRQLARLMPAQGSFSFTVEESTKADVELRSSLRYAHSEQGLRRLAREHGFELAALERRPVREDQRQPIAGLFVWLEKSR